eukprot:jgi/Chlat1/7279/Chrsp58S06915
MAAMAMAAAPAGASPTGSSFDHPGVAFLSTSAAAASEASSALADAFQDDPLAQWLQADKRRRATMMGGDFRAHIKSLNWGIAKQEKQAVNDRVLVVRGDDGEMVAVAVTEHMPSGAFETLRMLWADPLWLWAVISGVLGVRHIAHADTVVRLIKSGREAMMRDRPSFWYLYAIGVRPEYQGRGFGSLLLSKILERAQSTGESVALEASSEHNRRLYMRMGFKEIAPCAIPYGGPPVYFMRWDPK